MKPSLPSPLGKNEVSEQLREESRAESNTSRPNPNTRRSSSRPSLLRSPIEGLPQRDENSRSRTDSSDQPSTDESSSASDGASDEPAETAKKAERVGGNSKAKAKVTSPTEEEIARLRDAMNAKILQRQQRARGSYGTTGEYLGARRVSPIKEEDHGVMSPSLNAAFSSPSAAGVRTSSTVSTESTESSSKTIRGSVPVTPAANLPLRTPSYPFPYVPGTPKTWSSAFHQPFTALSPTVTSQPAVERSTPGDNSVMSGGSTPAADTSTFMPPGAAFQGHEDPRYPTPNLYDMVLHLNAEPGLEAWWATVTNLMHDLYKAERVTLVVPADPTDIENVPWGQKATFNLNGPDIFTHLKQSFQQPSTSAPRPEIHREPPSDDMRPSKLHPERLRPRLESRHSYAGQAQTRDVTNETSSRSSANARPAGPQRTVTHASGMLPTQNPPPSQAPRRHPSQASVRHTSLSDPEFSSVGGELDNGPYAEIFPTLRPMDYEADPLIESTGINRVLEKGRVVNITRDYIRNVAGAAAAPATPDTRHPTAQQTAGATKLFANYRSVFASDNAPPVSKNYEEYEQFPTSPWAQSPAPSPAIQSDPEDNPFFASEETVIEDSFNPAGTPKDYSQYGTVEAIGVDRASTVSYVPLVHPLLSQPMQSLRLRGERGGDRPDIPRSNTFDGEKKAPIAILSILSPAVPYPHNLTQSLKLLGPHLATAYSNALQFSSTHTQALGIRHRRTASGHNAGFAPISIEPTSLDDLVNADLDEPGGSMSGSMTSPSDYSGRSRHSPSGSLVGTPGWDPAAHGWTSSRSLAGTPAVSGGEMIDSYFDAKKKTALHRSGSSAGHTGSVQSTPLKSAQKTPTQDTRSAGRKPSPPVREDSRTPRSERKVRTDAPAKDDRSPLRSLSTKEHSPTRMAEPPSPYRPALRNPNQHPTDPADHRHSLLHSYGADFSSSFQTLPATTAVRTPGTVQSHNRKTSYSDSLDMPPPSERLLRTIIDSLPVQIFTAAPGTGHLTWVNSKFLIYRGQDSRQVLSEPWKAIHPEDRSDYMETWNRSLRTGQQLQQKVRLHRFDGSYRWFYVRAAPLKDKRQHIVHWIGTNMDFHEQHIAEVNSSRQQETAASEAKYRALANSSPQIVFAVNKAKGVTFCNTQWVYYSGQTEAQALGVGFMDYVHPDDLAKCRLPTFDEGSNQATNVPTSMPPEPRRTKSQSAASSSGSSETERGPSSSDTSSPISAMPQAKLSQLASTGILKVSKDADGRPSYSTEVRLKSKDGEYRWHLVRVLLAEPLLQNTRASDEETWYGTCTDINDHKALERDLKETMDEKSRFLSNMSHEIRTPLNGITGMVNFLIDSSLSAEQMEHVNIIRASTEGLRGLINDILDLSKAEAGMIQLNMDWLHIRSLLEEVNDLTSAMAIDKGLELNYLVEDDVPPMIKGDRFRIRQILLNVIGNAIKFTQHGEVFVRCEAHVDEDMPLPKNEMFIKFEVIDTGRGFTDKEAQYLFKRFSQIDGSSTRQHGGTGLGLVISRQLAQLHGGDMSAKGVPGKGSTFTFLIKTSLPSKDDQPPLPPPTPGAANLPLTPLSPAAATPTPMPKLSKMPSLPSHIKSAASSPRWPPEFTQSPSVSSDTGRDSPSLSSASSDPSIRSVARTSIRSERSSASSYVPDPSMMPGSPMKLAMPGEGRQHSISVSSSSSESGRSNETIKPISTPSEIRMSSPGGGLIPPMYSILVVCPLKYSRDATVQHIDMTLPKNIPHQITARDNLIDCQKMLGGDNPMIFTHVVAVLQDVAEIIALIDQVLSSPAHVATSIILITDLSQKRKIFEQAPSFDFDQLIVDRRVRFIFKPLKPSRFAVIFDPQKEREMSTDRNQDSAQQVAVSQKQVFEELTKRLGNKDKRVLLVEDNKVNQMVSTCVWDGLVCNRGLTTSQVILKFFSKVSISVETALDGVLCTEKIFSKPHGYYSVILV